MSEFTLDSVFMDDFLGNVEGIEIDFGLTSIFSLVLNDDLGGIDGLDDHGGHTA